MLPPVPASPGLRTLAPTRFVTAAPLQTVPRIAFYWNAGHLHHLGVDRCLARGVGTVC